MKLTWIQPDNLHVWTDFNVQQILCDDNTISWSGFQNYVRVFL